MALGVPFLSVNITYPPHVSVDSTVLRRRSKDQHRPQLSPTLGVDGVMLHPSVQAACTRNTPPYYTQTMPRMCIA